MTNVTAEAEMNPENLKKLLKLNKYLQQSDGEKVLSTSQATKYRIFVEVEPGKVLSGMVKRTIKDVNCFSINSIADIKKLKMNSDK